MNQHALHHTWRPAGGIPYVLPNGPGGPQAAVGPGHAPFEWAMHRLGAGELAEDGVRAHHGVEALDTAHIAFMRKVRAVCLHACRRPAADAPWFLARRCCGAHLIILSAPHPHSPYRRP